MGSGTKGLGDAQINFFCHSARSEAEMQKVERLQAISLEAYNPSAFRIATLRACAE